MEDVEWKPLLSSLFWHVWALPVVQKCIVLYQSSVLDAFLPAAWWGDEHCSTYCACYLSALGREGLTC